VISELLFRIIFSTLWLVFFTTILWVRYSSREPASTTSVGRTAQHERRLHIVALALFAPIWFGGIFFYAIFPGWILVLSIPLPDWFRLTMVGFATLGILFALWGYRTLGRNWVHAFEPSEFLQKKSDVLVTTGPYRYVRNPIYLGMFTFIIALALVAANWLLLLPSFFISTLVYMQISSEEKMLIARFGDKYRDYMKQTPRFIPRFRNSPPN
jgi:protein-S-isoprenylcysteine O-methyltransferase Ste14